MAAMGIGDDLSPARPSMTPSRARGARAVFPSFASGSSPSKKRRGCAAGAGYECARTREGEGVDMPRLLRPCPAQSGKNQEHPRRCGGKRRGRAGLFSLPRQPAQRTERHTLPERVSDPLQSRCPSFLPTSRSPTWTIALRASPGLSPRCSRSCRTSARAFSSSITDPDAAHRPRTTSIFRQCRQAGCRSRGNSAPHEGL